MSAVDVLTPCLTTTQVTAYLEQFYDLRDTEVEELGSYFDQNFLVKVKDGRRFIFKIHDANERRAVLDMQNKTMQTLTARINDIEFPAVQLSNSGEEIIELGDGSRHCARLLSFVPGRLLADCAKPSAELLAKVGAALGLTDSALRGFEHPAATRTDLPWDLKNAPQVKTLLPHITEPDVRRIVDYFLLQYDTEVLPALPSLRQSIVHLDFHRYSVLLDEEAEQVQGVIDFGDTVYTATVFNVAVAMYDATLNRDDPVAATAAVVAGYHSQFALTETEISLLYYLVASRLCIYAAIAAHYRDTKSHNAHAQMKCDAVHQALRQWIAINPDFAHDCFRRACSLPSKLPSDRELSEAVALRERNFPRSLYTHYSDPLHLNRGALQYLYDTSGQTYLDCVNNVCQLGHCHPTVVRAIQRQAARLNTNSRYIYDVMAEYAERLTATLPDPLNVCFLVNSGSEANDLALRLASAYTGRRHVIVIDKAYHGNSNACTEISPQRIDRAGNPGLPEHVHKVSAPDTFRGPHRGEDAAELYAADVNRVSEDLQRDGGISAFIAESLIGTGGQIVLPPGYLKHAYHHVRTHGGICIADEVQVGFGRVGTHTWCFETQNVVPDIVTMGKPIANGHPMAAVVTSMEIAAAFNNGVTYFNTFGGNPVSCSAALAVLDVLEAEGLQQNVVERSEQLLNGLRQLQKKYASIGDVRGLGLYVGVELITNRETLSPATELAQAVVEQMKCRGVLISTNGYDNNIIKLKPPLIVTEGDIKRLLRELDTVLSDLGAQK